MRRGFFVRPLPSLLALLVLAAPSAADPVAGTDAAGGKILLATTTSVRDSGLLDT